MLSETVITSYSKTESDGIHTGQLTVTGVSPCPYGTYINYHKLDLGDREVTGEDRLRMDDGNYQEDQCLDNLRHAGYSIRYSGKEQLTLHIGRASITGRPDGLILVDNREDVLSIKAMNSPRFTNFRLKGFEAEPFIKCQEQLYLASEEFKEHMAGAWVYAKHKDSCQPFDLFEEKNLAYSRPILDALDSIVLDKEEVKRPEKPIELCSHCRHSNFCWSTEILDTSKIVIKDLPDAVKQWKLGKFHKDYGEELIEASRDVFEKELGREELLLVENLRIKRIDSTREYFNQSKFITKFGASELKSVMDIKDLTQMRITEVGE